LSSQWSLSFWLSHQNWNLKYVRNFGKCSRSVNTFPRQRRIVGAVVLSGTSWFICHGKKKRIHFWVMITLRSCLGYRTCSLLPLVGITYPSLLRTTFSVQLLLWEWSGWRQPSLELMGRAMFFTVAFIQAEPRANPWILLIHVSSTESAQQPLSWHVGGGRLGVFRGVSFKWILLLLWKTLI
jgi:hypothetical protein